MLKSRVEVEREKTSILFVMSVYNHFFHQRDFQHEAMSIEDLRLFDQRNVIALRKRNLGVLIV